jgi:branched-chain amino acid transport system permease protein
MTWVNAIVQGVLLGGLYALLAAGLSLVFGVMRVVNLAHGALAILAAYLALVFVDATGAHPFLSLLVVVPVLAGVGYLLQRYALNRAIARGPLAPLLVTFGLAITLENVLLETFSADNRILQLGALGTGSLQVGGDLAVGYFPLLTFVVGVAVIAGLRWFLFATAIGRSMRAVSDDGEAAQLMGVNPRHVYALATALALGTVAVAGVFFGMKTTYTPLSGADFLIFAFEAVIIGGLGSLWGTLAGGVVLGVAQLVGATIAPAYGVLAGHLVFLAILAFRSQGLFPRTVTA